MMLQTTITGNWRLIVYTLFAGLFLLINYGIERTQFAPLIACYGSAFLLYIVLFKYWKSEHLINEAKWKSASIYCETRGMTFRVITEKSIYHQGVKAVKKKKAK